MAVVAVTLADVFFTVLFPGSGHGPLRRPLSHLTWALFRMVGRRLSGPRRASLLAYAGPVLVVGSIAVWPVLLTVGWGLLFQPALGSGLTASSGPTDRSWATALYVSGFSLTTLGTGDVTPQTGLWRFLTVLEAAVGFAVFSMAITYFVSLSTAVVQRKTFAATLDHRTRRTGDSARFVVDLAARGGLSTAAGQLASTGEYLEQLFQTHQSYPVLRYFHYREVRYSLVRILLVGLDGTALFQAALDHGERGQVTTAAAAGLVEGPARELLEDLVPHGDAQPAAASEAHWRRRFAAATAQFAEAGLPVRQDGRAVEDYLDRRRAWDAQLHALALTTCYEWEDVEPSHVEPSHVGPSHVGQRDPGRAAGTGGPDASVDSGR